ncbi:3-keto-5-aminohexanoate cleavage protein [Bauldia sp.]|uniref:3-keto-5-aminohexanoate cleavage protein n=1 Tax=Bauldia sp. TaxID=2575872 RepID=UPI003BA8CE16
MADPTALTGRPVLLAVAPNGARRTRADHPGLPLTAADLAATATSCLDAGAAMIHLHVRDDSGAHVLDADLYKAAIRAVRDAVGDRMIVQISTEAGGRYQPEHQIAVVGQVRPEAVSLALRELCPDSARETAFAAFLAVLAREKIVAQFILYDSEDIARLVAMMARGIVPHEAPPVLYVLGRYSSAADSRPIDLLPLITAAKGQLSDFMVCAFGPREAACVTSGALLGGDVRVGFENNIARPDGRRAPDNAALVTAVRDPLARLGFRTADADTVRSRWLRG